MTLRQLFQKKCSTKISAYPCNEGRDGLLRRCCLLALVLVCVAQSAWARDVYFWSKNVAIDTPAGSRQQGETALATDGQDKVWLSFIDADYHQMPNKKWVAWPRKLRLFVSKDAGKTFIPQPDLAEPGGDQALASDLNGPVYATYVHYAYDDRRQLCQRIALKNLATEQSQNETCLPWDENTRHDQSNLHIGKNGVVHVIGTDIAAPATGKRPKLLYARSTDGGKTCIGQKRIEALGELAQVAYMDSGLLIVGPFGYYVSADHGKSFSEKITHRFGAKLVRLALSPDRRTAYVVGDSTSGGLHLHASADGGKTWRMARVDDAPSARAWRYPAIHVDDKGRIHVVWMDDRSGSGALYHAYSDDDGASFSPSSRVSDQPFPFPADAPPPPPSTQNGTWIGDFLSLTTVGDRVITAWSDQRLKTPRSVVFFAAGKVSIPSQFHGDTGMSERALDAEKRREFALKVFEDFPGKISLSILEKILSQQVVLGMAPYEAHLAAGAFAFKVEADQSKWPNNSDPYKVMWAQSTKPDHSKIWMTFETDTQYPDEGLTLFKVHFKDGVAVNIEKLKAKGEHP